MNSRNIILLFILLVALIAATQTGCSSQGDEKNIASDSSMQQSMWVGASVNQIPYYSRKDGELIWYGRELIANTSKYLGPKGSVLQISNGMNCQNCHLDAGTRPWGNNYGAVYSTYPKFRDRSGGIETIYKRVNDCIERSLNGRALDTGSKEMQAIYAYIKWLGEDVKRGEKPKGSGIVDLPYLNRAANPQKGKEVYVQKCQTCHGTNGEGQLHVDGNAYTYPPLWGNNSYNVGAGLFRLSRFAGYVKNNMPFGADYHAPQLSAEEAWDVAAFVNSQPRPAKDLKSDWPDISKKPIDHPFGPYADPFTEEQHKYGPFAAIKTYKEQNKNHKPTGKH
ncbi:c-type cytochrome [Lacibacter luteus]|uniref:C-type cytochrome n=1 Tax=Lacibacter luteus TaxID=2508719 RepID=A0A4Q1CJS1_9BACT|nr:c-type cytochrome [Lacibacter luteus]RXK60921.1 c-type cytochrome [Lacibacter luteus]